MKKWLMAISGIIGGILLYAFIEPFRYKVKKYDINHPNIPSDFDGFKIVFLADIHYGRLSKEGYLTRVVNRVNEIQPDVVLLGGDYITHKKYIEPCFLLLSQLKSKEGIYAVIGNHDVVESLSLTESCMKSAGIKSVNNDAVWIQKTNRIKIGGVGDLTTQEQNCIPLIQDLKHTDYAILLTHNPKFVYQIKPQDHIGLVLAGHTHGAQFAMLKHLGKLGTDEVNQKIGLKYLSGMYHYGDMDIIVSNGVGTAKFPFRFFTPPEIISIQLKAKK